MRTWIYLAMLAAVFLLLGLGLGLGGLLGSSVPLAVAGGVVLLVGIALAVPVPRVRRQQLIGGGELQPVAPGSATSDATPWTFEDLGRELAAAFADTPYLVEGNRDRLRVRADLADARFLTFAGASGVVEVRTVDVVRLGEARATLVDSALSARWRAGVGQGGLELSGSVSQESGRKWSYERRVEIGADRDGIGPKVDYTFSFSELRRPAVEVVERAGWRTAMSAETKVGLAFALLGASSVVVVPVALLIAHLTG